MCGSRGGTEGPDPPPENHENVGFSSNTGPDPPGKSLLSNQHLMFGHHRHTSEAPFNGVSLAADDGPLIVVFGSSLPTSTKKKKKKKKKNIVKVGPPLTKHSGSAHDFYPKN